MLSLASSSKLEFLEVSEDFLLIVNWKSSKSSNIESPSYYRKQRYKDTQNYAVKRTQSFGNKTCEWRGTKSYIDVAAEIIL